MSQIARVELKQCTVVEISSLYFVELPLHYKIQRTYFHYCITDILNMLQNIVYLFYTLLWKESESSGVDVAPSPGLLETWHLHLMYYYCAAQSFTLQYDTVQYSTVQYGTVRYSMVQYGTVLYSTVRYSTVWYIMVQNSTVWYSMVQYGPHLGTLGPPFSLYILFL